MKITVGDIVTIRPHRQEMKGLELAIVTSTDTHLVRVVHVVDDHVAATELDPIISADVYGKKTALVVVTLAEAVIFRDQIEEVIANVDSNIRDEIIGCRYGNPSNHYDHGQWLFPAPLDSRHDWLTGLIRSFIHKFSIGDRETTVGLEVNDLAEAILRESSLEDQKTKIEIYLDYIRARKETFWHTEEQAFREKCQTEFQQAREDIALLAGPAR